MAVHTPLSRQQIADFIAPFQLGELVDFSGINDGIENTNYFITIRSADKSEEDNYVLTIFEKLNHSDATFYLELMERLAQGGLPVPAPIMLRSANSSHVQTLLGKPAAILPRLHGTHPQQPNLAQCLAIGEALAKQHLLTRDMNYRGSQYVENILANGQALRPAMNTDDGKLFDSESAQAKQFLENVSLPRGIIHGDLFRDNVLSEGDTVTGLLDYYNAIDAPLLLDVAITVNDWCSNKDNQLDEQRVKKLLNGYQSLRPFHEEEIRQWQNSLCFAALRFWLSRLQHQQDHQTTVAGTHFPRKDPNEFRQRLINLRQNVIQL